MTFDTIVRNGTLVTACDTFRADLGIREGRIAATATRLDDAGAKVIDAEGLFVIPGGVDVHTHLDMPLGETKSSDDFESGTIAAAFGGTTTIVDFAVQEKGGTLAAALDTWMRKAAGKAVIDYGFHCLISDLNDATLDEIPALMRQGVTSFKLFMAYPGRLMLNDGAILRVMQRAAALGALVYVHAENGDAIDLLVRQAIAEGKREPRYHALTRPTRAEAEATARAIALAEISGAPLCIAHVSCFYSLQAVREGRAKGLPVYAETCPQYLYLSLDNYDLPGFEGAKFVFTPPPREKWNQEKLWDGLALADLQIVSTDHCPFCYATQKTLGRDDFTHIPNGGPGIEHRLELLYTGGVHTHRFSPNRFVDLVSTTPAKLFGLYPRKGSLAVGADADIVVFDPDAEGTLSAATHHMNVDYSLYEGVRVKGRARTVLSRGNVVVDNGAFLGRAGAGEYLPRRGFQRP